jgi:hypothetical protein
LCQKYNIECNSLEYGSTSDKYEKFINTYPQDPCFWQKKSLEKWVLPSERKYEIAESFFRKNRNRTNRISFVLQQEYNAMPSGFSKSDCNIAVYDTRLIENCGLSEYIKDIYFMHIIYILTQLLCNNKRMQFYYRAHPTKSNCYTASYKIFSVSTQAKYLRVLYHMHLSNLHIILPHDKVDSYALLDNSNIVLVANSTIGVEATFWGKPSIAWGESWYKTHDATYNPETFNELFELLCKNDLKPKPQVNSFIYAYYMETYGKNFTLPNRWFWGCSSLNLMITELFDKLYFFKHFLKKILKRILIASNLYNQSKESLMASESEIFIDQGSNTFDIDESEVFYSAKPSKTEITQFFDECRRVAHMFKIPVEITADGKVQKRGNLF